MHTHVCVLYIYVCVCMYDYISRARTYIKLTTSRTKAWRSFIPTSDLQGWKSKVGVHDLQIVSGHFPYGPAR